MYRAILAIFMALQLYSVAADAQGRVELGWGRLFTNDFLGDNKDRWRTGSYTVSKVVGRGWNGVLPEAMGEILEFRFRSETMAPASLIAPAPGDRRYAGVLSLGVHTQFEKRGVEFRLGGDLVFTGPQTGVGRLQSEIHKILGATVPTVLGNQIPNGIFPTLTAEAGRPFAITPNVIFRPFVEGQAGVETLIRFGGDLHIGQVGLDDLYLRDVVTGQRFRATRGGVTGFAAVLGADAAYVAGSAYLPASDGYVLTDARLRVRAGVHWQGEKSSVFYGLTWLSEEFEAQSEPQVQGSVQLNIRF